MHMAPLIMIAICLIGSIFLLNHLGALYEDLTYDSNQERENYHHDFGAYAYPAEAHHCYAIVRTNNANSKYLGAYGVTNVYNPTVSGSQWSAARMRLRNGQDSIEVGWMVNEDLFKNNETHLYIRFTAGEKGCFNLECPGFVSVAKDVPIGLVPDKISQRDKQQYGWKLSIIKHKDDGNWWVSIGDDDYAIGYWPKSLFTSLAGFASQIEWGGEVYIPSGQEDLPLPEMGCGNKPDSDTSLSAVYANTTVVDQNFQNVKPPENIVKVQNCKNSYSVEDAGVVGPAWGRLFLFGGPLPSNL